MLGEPKITEKKPGKILQINYTKRNGNYTVWITEQIVC